MRIAVVTPCHNTPQSQLDQCRRSVLGQTVPCTHILVNDGGQPPQVDAGCELPIIHLPQAHRDAGNAARAIGSVSAICQGFDAIAYLDADNWYEPNHLESLAALHGATGAAFCSSARNLYRPDRTLLGRCPEVDGERFVDTSCMFLTRAAFPAVAAWYLMGPERVFVGDRYVWEVIKNRGVTRAHTGLPTVCYRTLFRIYYDYFGVAPPAEAKETVWDPEQNRVVVRPCAGPQ